MVARIYWRGIFSMLIIWNPSANHCTALHCDQSRSRQAMGHYKSNVRDIEFNLFEVFGTDRLLGTAPFESVDEDTARGIIAEVAKLAEGPLAESFADGDPNPPVFDPDTHSVTLPESFKKSYKTLHDSE